MMSGADGSYPAAYSTLEAVDSRRVGGRRTTLGFWFAALALLAVGGSGAVFAVNRASAKNAQGTMTSPSSGMTAAPATSIGAVPATSSAAALPPTTSASAAPSDPEPRSAGKEGKSDAGAKSAPAAAPTGGPARTPRATTGPQPPSTRPQPRSAVTSTRPEDQVIPPDPFGTPD
jgi:hypothetical protein